MLAQINESKAHHADLDRTKILIIEDEVLFARAVAKRLKKASFECEHAENLADGLKLAKQFLPDFVLLDMRLPDGNGLDIITNFISSNTQVIVMTAHGEVSDAVQAIKLGASDYLKKPIDLDELLLIIQKNEKSFELKTRLDYSRQRNTHDSEGVGLIGDGAAMQSVRMQVDRVAKLGHLLDAIPPTVLITGETGTGKDVAARMLHASCAKKDKPFVHVDCASLPSELIESELFGHEKGAFTNATSARPGLIEAAEDGTIFLDEIGELPLQLQAKLLNVLERRKIRRLGSTKERNVLARIIAATNRDLHAMSQQGSFRSDLYFRLNVISFNMPPLRERGTDILQLAQHFLNLTEKRYGLTKHYFADSAIDALNAYGWPGNVRELRHQISRAVLLANDEEILVSDLALPSEQKVVDAEQMDTSGGKVTLDVVEKNMLMNALEESHNNVSKAARILGITRMTMRYRMEKHDIKI